MKKITAGIIENHKVAAGFYRMSVKSSYLAKNARPGQFFEVRCPDDTGAFLRRPLGAHRINKGGVEMLYEIVGKGTAALSGMKAGQELDIIGPLGNGFSLNRQTGKPANRQTILVAGGVGVAPLVALAEAIVNQLTSLPVNRLTVLIGAKTQSHILCEKEFKKLNAKILIATEDGSKGHKGFITELLPSLLNRQTGKPANRQTTIYACGPVGMLKAVAAIAKKYGVPCQVSMEERMACGVGVCLGCPVKVHRLTGSPVNRLKPANRQTGKPADHTYKMVCKDGPVFDAREIAW